MREPNIQKIIIIAIILLFAACAVPAGALITTSTQATFDADGTSAGAGEEIQVQVTITPGDAEIRDLTIDLSERDALIDDTSFRHTIAPTGASVNVEKNGHSLTCDHLAPGESIILSFNAYPETLKQEDLAVADVTYTYVQQGETLHGSDTITADTSTSLWFQNLALQGENGVSWTLYAGVLLIILSLALIGYQWSRNGKAKNSADAENKKLRKVLEDVSKKLDLIQDNPSMGEDLKKKIDRELESEAPTRSTEKSVHEKHEKISPEKKSRFD